MDRAWVLLHKLSGHFFLGTLSTAIYLVTLAQGLKIAPIWLLQVHIELDQDENHSWSSSSPALDRHAHLSGCMMSMVCDMLVLEIV